MNKRAVVTGATGYLGSVLVRQLVASGWEVFALIRPSSDLGVLGGLGNSLNFIVDDKDDAALESGIARSQPDTMFHLAAQGGYDHPGARLTQMLDANITFGVRVIEAMLKTDCRRVVVAGSYWQHYQNEDYNPVCLYAATKQAFESMLRYYVEVEELRAVVLTLFDTYGPGDPRPKIFGQILDAARKGVPLELTPGEQIVDLVHAEDVARAFVLAAKWLADNDTPALHRFAVSSGDRRSVRQIVEAFAALNGLTVKLKWSAKPYRARQIMQPWDRGTALPGWTPAITLEDGLRTLLSRAEGGRA